MNKPAWLPEMVSVDGEFNEVLARLYGIFKKDLKDEIRILNSSPVFYDRRILDDKFEEGFWHLITKEDEKTRERHFEPRRAERLPWCGPTISNADDVAVKAWSYREAKGRLRTYVWLEHWDYVIILEKRRQRIGKVFFLVTAFYVEGESTRSRLRKKYTARVH